MRRQLLIAAVFALAMTGPSTWAVDGASASIGEGARNNVLDTYRLAARWQWDRRWFEGSLCHVAPYWDVSAAMFENDVDAAAGDDAKSRLYLVAIAPVFRLQFRPLVARIAPFIDFAIGAGVVSETKLRTSDDSPRELGSHFQFEDRIVIGVRFGSRQQAEVALQRVHYSNLGVGGENDGLDTHLLMFAWHF